MAADLESLVALMPFAANLGIILEEANEDRVIAVLPGAPRLCTTGGIIHGGALMTLADTAGALLAHPRPIRGPDDRNDHINHADSGPHTAAMSARRPCPCIEARRR